MTRTFTNAYTAFDGHQRIASGPLQTVALVVKQALEDGAVGPVLVFDDDKGRSIDIDTRGTEDEVLARLALTTGYPRKADEVDANEPRGRGRPKLGVVAREVTLLPRHWEWLASQPGGASVAIRKLVEDAKRINSEKDKQRKTQERAYHFMTAMAGDLPDFEEATRALFANEPKRLREVVAEWPEDVREHAIALAYGNGPEY